MSRAMKPFRFRLYVAGGHVGSARAEPDLRQALDACVAGGYDLEVVDINARPDLARADEVLAVPTVIRVWPEPRRRAVGALASVVAVASALELPLPAS